MLVRSLINNRLGYCNSLLYGAQRRSSTSSKENRTTHSPLYCQNMVVFMERCSFDIYGQLPAVRERLIQQTAVLTQKARTSPVPNYVVSTFDLRHVVNQLTETVLQIQFVDYCQACFVVGLTSRGCRHLERCCSLYISFIMSLTSFERLKNTEARFPSSVIAVPAFTSSSLCRRAAEAANNTVV